MKITKHHQLVAALLIGGILDSCLWLLLLLGQSEAFSPVHFLGLRGVLGGIIVLLIAASHRLFESSHSVVLAIFAGVFFVAFGIVGILGILLVFRMIWRKTLQTGELYHIDREEGEEFLKKKRAETAPTPVHLGELRKVAPLADGMTDEDKDIRIAAILAMEEVDSPSMYETLLAARNDPDKAVQYYALEALKKIGDAYTERIKDLLNIVNTGDVPGYDAYKQLADLYAQFAAADIEHPVLVKFYQQEAVKYYSHILETYPEHRQDILQQFIPALYTNKEYRRCIAFCEEIRQQPESARLSILYKARCLFALRDIPTLKAFALQEKDSDIEALTGFLQLGGEERWYG